MKLAGGSTGNVGPSAGSEDVRPMSQSPKPFLIAPSILSSDFARLGDELSAIDAAGADWVHIDVMDGHFVPNITLGPPVIRSIRRCTALPFDVHLMIEPVDPFIPAFADAGADIITIHAEAGPHVHRSLQLIRSLGKKAGVVYNPGTDVAGLEYLIDEIDMVLLMTVNPGFGGQAFIAAMLDKVRKVKALIGDRPIRIEIDGGVSTGNVRTLCEAGADVLVAGTAVFKGGTEADYIKNIKALRDSR
jgi:ribulose-phosphate 3-epimerase